MPTCNHGPWIDVTNNYSSWISDFSSENSELIISPEQRRWAPQEYIEGNFVDSIRTMMGAGSPGLKEGLSISYYSCTSSMSDKKLAIYSADGDFIIVP